MNRLKLDFSLESNIERKNFLEKYLAQDYFKEYPLTPTEIETCANYILWGKDPDGKNPVQKKEIQIETKNKTWNNSQNEESLDALLETPTFNESLIRENTAARPLIKKEKFSRKEALQNAPKFLVPVFQQLFLQIDTLELLLNFYDLRTGRREEPPRQALIEKFKTEEIEKLKSRAEGLTQFQYLKLRHQLVELRRQQYTLKDSYSSPLQREGAPTVQLPLGPLVFECDVQVAPVGIYEDFRKSCSYFRDKEQLIPMNFGEEDLKRISKKLWRARDLKTKLVFDFREIEHVYELLLALDDMRDAALDSQTESTTKQLLDTLEFYIKFAELDALQTELLEMKIKKIKNQDIADYINKKYNKTYTANYISTIFRQKIIKKINEGAKAHEKIVENLFFPENFKQCSTCKKWILRDPDNFIRKSRAKDGLSNRCKACDKKARQKKKEEDK